MYPNIHIYHHSKREIFFDPQRDIGLLAGWFCWSYCSGPSAPEQSSDSARKYRETVNPFASPGPGRDSYPNMMIGVVTPLYSERGLSKYHICWETVNPFASRVPGRDWLWAQWWWSPLSDWGTRNPRTTARVWWIWWLERWASTLTPL